MYTPREGSSVVRRGHQRDQLRASQGNSCEGSIITGYPCPFPAPNQVRRRGMWSITLRGWWGHCFWPRHGYQDRGVGCFKRSDRRAEVCWLRNGPDFGWDGKVFWPGLASAAAKSSGSGLYWHKCITLMNELVNKYDEAALEILLLTIIKQRNLILWARRERGAPRWPWNSRNNLCLWGMKMMIFPS